MNNKLIVVVDYGMGNLRSVTKAAEHVAPSGCHIKISQNASDITNADAIIFPGQGAAKACMQAIKEHNLNDALLQAAQSKPFLGICMGLQVLMSHSNENNGVDCLNRIEGTVEKFQSSPEAKIPHMGWNQIHQHHDHPMWHKIPQDSRFYFVHSYYVSPTNPQMIQGTTEYANLTFASCLAEGQLFAIQAHPEKSAQAGLQLFKNFMTWPIESA
ncbi:imidazole glycerol phosphate synthase subunit HisH [Thiomicrospira sp. ALE5]|uniref:imidazole glycerol phosphate synthase subunit HisH n=1 Tax=Thiomicrospira sp. ALE5 TaxID=748650 RepID=UPI0008EC9622|nr:imidazole glycerol phosphate synthase subunit HisH [Thiomicrospira sp. ALE5]SFR55301.1 glutamine amidotransferase [Thiomicrospira sp. ALE5]